jgi:ankyrin repeat protein
MRESKKAKTSDVLELKKILIEAIQDEDDELVESLLDKGMRLEDINHQDSLGYTALHHAIKKDNLKITKLLLNHGADYTIKTNRFSDGRLVHEGRDSIGIALESESSKVINFITKYLRDIRLTKPSLSKDYLELSQSYLANIRKGISNPKQVQDQVEESDSMSSQASPSLQNALVAMSSGILTVLQNNDAIEKYSYQVTQEVAESTGTFQKDYLNSPIEISGGSAPFLSVHRELPNFRISAIINPQFQANKFKLLESGDGSIAGSQIGEEGKMTGENNLHLCAIYLGNSELANELLLSGKYQINDKDLLGRTPLHRAVQMKNKELVCLLLAFGADVNCEYINPNDPSVNHFNRLIKLSEAMRAKQKQSVKPVSLEEEFSEFLSQRQSASLAIQEPVASSALIAPSDEIGKHGNTPLMIAFKADQNGENLEMILLLVNHPEVNFNTPGDESKTLLHIAVGKGMYKVVEALLVTKKIQIDAQDESKMTALHSAVEKGDVKMIDILIANGASVHLKNDFGKTALDILMDNYKDKIHSYDQETKKVNDRMITYIQQGISVDQEQLALVELSKKQDEISALENSIRLLSDSSSRSLYCNDQIARQNPDIALYDALRRGRGVEVIRDLLEKVESPNIADANKITPLHIGAENGDESVFQLLLEKRGLINFKNKIEETPLDIAVRHNNAGIVRLLSKKPNFNIGQDFTKKSPFEVAVENKNLEILELLIPNFLKIMDKRNYNPIYDKNLPEACRKILENDQMKKVFLEYKNSDGQSFVHIACRRGHESLVELLKESKIDFSEKDKNGKTPIDLALENKQLKIVSLLTAQSPSLEALGLSGAKALVESSREHDRIP